MAATDIELCNEALGLIGHKKPISSLTANTVEAQQCAIYYPKAKGVVLARHPWDFAERTVLLAEHATASDVRWTHTYAAPTDMEAPRYLWSGLRNPTADDAIPFQRADKGTGTNPDACILTDLDDARLVYTTKSLPIVAFPTLVQDAVAWQLAAYLCGPLAVEPRLTLAVDGRADAAWRRAAALESNKGQRDLPQDPEAMRVR